MVGAGRVRMWFSIAAAGVVAGCGTRIKAYEGDVRPEGEVAHLDVEYQAATAWTQQIRLDSLAVDGMKIGWEQTNYKSEQQFMGPRRYWIMLDVLPGSHDIVLGCRSTNAKDKVGSGGGGGGLVGAAVGAVVQTAAASLSETPQHLGEKSISVSLEAGRSYRVDWVVAPEPDPQVPGPMGKWNIVFVDPDAPAAPTE